MAELTILESKLAEVIGLAVASRAATEKVKLMLDERERDLTGALEQMGEEARQTVDRCTDVADGFEGKKTAILKEARQVRQEAAEMMKTYLEDEDEALDGFEFLTMAEAGEVGHWEILQQLGEQADLPAISRLARWALPIQERHLAEARRGALALASRRDPNATED
jgi:hypothetical protein